MVYQFCIQYRPHSVYHACMRMHAAHAHVFDTISIFVFRFDLYAIHVVHAACVGKWLNSAPFSIDNASNTWAYDACMQETKVVAGTVTTGLP